MALEAADETVWRRWYTIPLSGRYTTALDAETSANTHSSVRTGTIISLLSGDKLVSGTSLWAEPLFLTSHYARAFVVPGCAECLHRMSTWHQMNDLIW